MEDCLSWPLLVAFLQDPLLYSGDPKPPRVWVSLIPSQAWLVPVSFSVVGLEKGTTAYFPLGFFTQCE